jgi:hypothetical protein
MKKNLLSFAFFGILMLVILGSCATTRKKGIEPVEVKPEIVVPIERPGIAGRVIPVDSSGKEITQEERDRVIINCIPIEEGSQLKERSVTVNPDAEGSFSIDLKKGEYLIEIFLEGFYVRNFKVVVEDDRRVNLGDIRIQRIEPGSGVPLKGDEIEEVFMNEGDVSIQPPTH